ncbi:ABC transporter ATP-binding protein [Streptomonospora arabica]|uniref:ABC transporter ATP-binding protein n=1 Tax=Streptomonospora arabica TaxID=412417 RepID=A0ABV9SLT3_9ACTN
MTTASGGDATAAPPAALAGLGLSFGYPDSAPVFAGLDVHIAPGEVVGVLGPNGGGKTTLLRLLSGSLTPDEGEIRLGGEPVRRGRRALAELRRSVQLVFQDPDDQLFSASVTQDVSFGPLNLGLDTAAARERVTWALEALEITDLAEQPTHLLSYGQRKRVVLAGALAMRPSVLVLDEPTAGLDPEGVESLVQTLEGLRAAGTTLVVSTHDVDLAWRWADTVLLLDRGRLASGQAREILADPALLAAARLRPPWAPAAGRALRAAGLLPPGTPGPATPEEAQRLLDEAAG